MGNGIPVTDVIKSVDDILGVRFIICRYMCETLMVRKGARLRVCRVGRGWGLEKVSVPRSFSRQLDGVHRGEMKMVTGGVVWNRRSSLSFPFCGVWLWHRVFHFFDHDKNLPVFVVVPR